MDTQFEILKEAVEKGNLEEVDMLLRVSNPEQLKALFTTPQATFASNAVSLVQLAIESQSIPILARLNESIPSEWLDTPVAYSSLYKLLDAAAETANLAVIQHILENVVPEDARINALKNSFCLGIVTAMGNTAALEYLLPLTMPHLVREEILSNGNYLAPCVALENGQQHALEYMLTIVPARCRSQLIQSLSAKPEALGYYAYLRSDQPAIQTAEENGHHVTIAFTRTPKFLLNNYAENIQRLMESGLSFIQVQACVRMATNPNVINLCKTERSPFKGRLPAEIISYIAVLVGNEPELSSHHGLEVLQAMQQTRPLTWQNTMNDRLYGEQHLDRSLGQKNHFLEKLCNIRGVGMQQSCTIL